jgi:serine/threonine-protein kinase HipA
LNALNVFVGGRRVGKLSTLDGFTHHLTYDRETQQQDFVSLLMPVRPESWTWPALHPFFQMSLPEGFLLSLLKEQLGPHLGSTPFELLSVVGQNMIGRVQVTAGEAVSFASAQLAIEPLLHSPQSKEVFFELLREYAASGVSGVFPKFLTPETKALFRKGSAVTERHIVKSSDERLPFLALNEHLCMEVVRRTGAPAPMTRVSDDGQVLLVERFDVDADGTRLGFEDCCSLLGLSADQKYNSTWERVTRLCRELVAPAQQRAALQQLALTLMLTYALGNSDCHTKNLGVLYGSADDVRIAPIYDMLTVRAYDRYAHNPPGMFIDGRKSWEPGKALWRVVQQHMQIEPAQQRELAQRVGDAVSAVVPELIHHARNTPGFAPVGARMVHEWNAGLKRLHDRTQVPVPDFVEQARAQGIEPAPLPPRPPPVVVGESPLLGTRTRRGEPAS